MPPTVPLFIAIFVAIVATPIILFVVLIAAYVPKTRRQARQVLRWGLVVAILVGAITMSVQARLGDRATVGGMIGGAGAAFTIAMGSIIIARRGRRS
jgi:hypothetical protein